MYIRAHARTYAHTSPRTNAHITSAYTCTVYNNNLLINLRSPRDYVGPPFVRSFALSLLDGASVREAHCEQASTAMREAHCAQATVARLVTFESLKWKYSFATNSALFMKLGSLLYLRCRHRSAKSTAVSNKTFLFQVTNIYLFCGSVTLST